jgi:glutathione S-transferase
MKIDVFAHVLPPRYLEERNKRAGQRLATQYGKYFHANPGLTDLSVRFRSMDKYPDIVHLLTIAGPNLESVLEPKDAKQRALASQWMDWQLSVVGPANFHAFWGLIRTPPEKSDPAAIKTSQDKTIDAMKMLDAQLGKTAYVAGSNFSYGDIPVGIMCYRYVQLVPGRPPTPNLDRWYAAISSRQAFKDHVGSIPLS